MPRQTDRILHGKTVTQPEFKIMVRDAVRAALEHTPDGVKIDDILLEMGWPPELTTKEARHDFVKALNRFADAGWLSRPNGRRGRYREGARGRIGWDTQETNEAIAIDILTANGGFMESRLLTRALGYRETIVHDDGYVEHVNDDAGRHEFMKSVWASKRIGCDLREQLFHLEPQLLYVLPLEGRWLSRLMSITTVHYAKTRVINDLGGQHRFDALWWQDMYEMYVQIGRRVRWVRTMQDKGIEELLDADPALRQALNEGVNRYAPATGQSKTIAGPGGRVADRRQRMIDLYLAFEDGSTMAHQALLTDFWIALSRLLRCDPVMLSRGIAMPAFGTPAPVRPVEFTTAARDALAEAAAEAPAGQLAEGALL